VIVNISLHVPHFATTRRVRRDQCLQPNRDLTTELRTRIVIERPVSYASNGIIARMPAIPISMPARGTNGSGPNPLPNILRTPSGLAILEIQGSLNSTLQIEPGGNLPVGSLDFPLYDVNAPASDTAWQKRVHLYIGKHQRLTGEVKKLPQAVAVLRKVPGESADGQALEVAEIIYYKVLFAARPEPVGTTTTE
jgi:chromosome transmission fidelity protein 8